MKKIVTIDKAGMVVCITDVPPGFEQRPEAVIVPVDGTHHVIDATVAVDLGMQRLADGSFNQHPATLARLDAEAQAATRVKRNRLLAAADIEVEKAIDDGDAERENAWRRYRTHLRAVPEQPGFPVAVDWPTQP